MLELLGWTRFPAGPCGNLCGSFVSNSTFAIRDVLNRHVGKTNLELFYQQIYQRFFEF